MDPEPWSVLFYLDAEGGSPVKEFLEGLQPEEQTAILRHLELVSQFGPLHNELDVHHIDGDIWELRVGQNRLFYFLHGEHRFVLLHGFRKKSAKTPHQEIDLCERRLEDFVEREEKLGQ